MRVRNCSKPGNLTVMYICVLGTSIFWLVIGIVPTVWYFYFVILSHFPVCLCFPYLVPCSFPFSYRNWLDEKHVRSLMRSRNSLSLGFLWGLCFSSFYFSVFFVVVYFVDLWSFSCMQNVVSVSLDCPFSIAPSGFSNVYLCPMIDIKYADI